MKTKNIMNDNSKKALKAALNTGDNEKIISVAVDLFAEELRNEYDRQWRRDVAGFVGVGSLIAIAGTTLLALSWRIVKD